jgi:hypothetical protein
MRHSAWRNDYATNRFKWRPELPETTIAHARVEFPEPPR